MNLILGWIDTYNFKEASEERRISEKRKHKTMDGIKKTQPGNEVESTRKINQPWYFSL
jgi:hypothetical protein